MLAGLRPAFASGGTVQAGNASGINDGTAALVLARESVATAAMEPGLMAYAPVLALQKLCAMTGTTVDDIDVVEPNEARDRDDVSRWRSSVSRAVASRLAMPSIAAGCHCERNCRIEGRVVSPLPGRTGESWPALPWEKSPLELVVDRVKPFSRRCEQVSPGGRPCVHPGVAWTEQ